MRKRTALVLIIAAALAGAAPVEAKTKPIPAEVGKVFDIKAGLGSLTLGLSAKQIRGILGKPDKQLTVKVNGRRQLIRYDYKKSYGLEIGFTNVRQVQSIIATGRRYRTVEGLHIGDTRKQFRATYPDMNCNPEKRRNLQLCAYTTTDVPLAGGRVLYSSVSLAPGDRHVKQFAVYR